MRVRYIDNQAQEGELDLARVRPGDRVRLLSDARDRAGPKGVSYVPAGTIGEVVELGPESLRIEAPGAYEAVGAIESQPITVEVQPDQVAILIDERDTRVGDSRLPADQRVGRAARVETWDLSIDVAHGRASGWPMHERRAALASGYLRTSWTLASRVSDETWRALVIACST